MRLSSRPAPLLLALLAGVACVPESLNRAPDPNAPELPADPTQPDPMMPTDPVMNPDLVMVALAVDPTKPMLEVGATQDFVATATMDDGSVVNVTALAAWQSADPTRLAVEAAGRVVALAVGQVDLRVAYGDFEVTANVDVYEIPVGPRPTALTVQPQTITVSPGGTMELRAEAAFDDGTSRDVTAEVTWTIDDPAIATLVGLQVTAVAEGQTTVRASWAGLMATVPVQVAGCTYPGSASSPIQVGSTMPPLAWDSAVAADGSPAPLNLEDVHCGRAASTPSVIIFVIGAGWCTACPSYFRSVNSQAAAIEAAGGMLVLIEAEDTRYRPADSAFADQHVTSMIGRDHGIRAGDGDTQPTARALYNAPLLRAFPSAFVVRTRDMRILIDQASSNGMLPFVRIAQNPDLDWSNPNAPPFSANCGPTDEEPQEPNDAPSQAQVIPAGTVDGGICAAAPDFYRVDIPGRWTMNLEFSHATGDIDVFVWDEARDRPLSQGGQEIGSDSGTDDEEFSHTGPALVKVYGYNNASAPYRLTLTAN